MSNPNDRLYELLPVIYRIRDAESGEPLRALLQVIGEQVNLVEEDIAQLYENWFVETCQDWVVPYIADLIGFRLVSEAGTPGSATTAEGRLQNKILIPRREVANTIRNRRRRGTLALLELLARDVSGWPARAVEFFRLLGVDQHLGHLRLDRGRTADLRNSDVLDRLDGPFDELAHTVDVRHISGRRSTGRYNIPSVGLFAWRLKPYSITMAPAYCVDRVRHHYMFSILGNDTPLFTLPVDEPEPSHIADEMNVPAPIRRRAFDERTADYYGEGKSLYIWRDDLRHPVRLENIVPADLSDWAYRPQGDQVAVDPRLGRIAFAPRNLPKTGVWVSYHYGFSDDIGGGEYERRLRPAGARALYRVGAKGRYENINDALARWHADKRRDDRWRDAVIEITDSGAYVEQIEIVLEPGDRLELRAADGARPVIRLLDRYTNRPDAMVIAGVLRQPDEHGEPYGEHHHGHEGHRPLPRLVLDGLLITGRSVQISDRLEEVIIRHCTLVPGWSLDQHCEPENETEPSLELINTAGRLIVDHSIVGTIQVDESEVKTDPIAISIRDSILDATRPALDALSAPGDRLAHAVLTIARSTVIGRVRVHAIELAENCIFDGRVRVARSQRGCMRFCYAPPGSRTPRRYNCQPDLVAAGLKDEERRRAEIRVRPVFNSVRYGTPTYCQLAPTCAEEIRRGADDESEMGVFHDLFQPQREANLRTRLDEFTPAGTDAGIVFVT